MYTLLKTENKARRGQFETVHGTFQTPCFMNVGTAAAIKGGISSFSESRSLNSGANQVGYATGYARSAIEDAYNGAAVNQAADSIPVENSVYVTVEIDGEEIANTTQRVATQQVAMANGR